MKNFTNLVVIFISFFGFSQQYKATINTIQQDGFHKIVISPQIRSASQDNLKYFRILDKNKKEVPYVVYDNLNRNSLVSEKLEIVNKSAIKDSISSFVIKNYHQKLNGEIVLEIANASINKYFSISGSNDQIKWFGLVANQLLTNLNNENSISVQKIISYPSNNYKFIKIDFNDKNALPINILNIGRLKEVQKAIETTILKDFNYKIAEDFKNKKTIITFSADNFQKVDEISFTIATKLFSRNAKLYLNRTRKIKKRTENYRDEISSFVLSSSILNSFQLNGFFEKEFTIEIENQDNQPLEISKIDVIQNNLYILSNLVSKEKYEVIIDTNYAKPKYDLANFVVETKEYPSATLSKLTKIENQNANVSEKPFWQSNAFMWICIVLGSGVIAYFALELLKDMKE